jgi:hypothetical protein
MKVVSTAIIATPFHKAPTAKPKLESSLSLATNLLEVEPASEPNSCTLYETPVKGELGR